jgi:RimJ/RimL family protein N-acetyltransferase
MFVRGAELALEFAFTTVGIHRLEARAAVHNGRGNAALHKLGAVQEAILRRPSGVADNNWTRPCGRYSPTNGAHDTVTLGTATI